MSTESLLPDNRTVLETALEKTLSEHLLNIESPYPQLWSPDDVPAEMLPYLAHAKGVQDWGDDTEAAKRQTVKDVWPVQRKAGTQYGIHTALDALGFDAEVSRVGAFDLSVDLFYRDQASTEPDVVGRAARRIERVKSERDTYTLNLNLVTRGVARTGSAMVAGDVVSVVPHRVTSGSVRGQSSFAAGLMMFDLIEVFPGDE